MEKRDQWKEENSFVVRGSEGRIRKSPVRGVGELISEGGGLFTPVPPSKNPSLHPCILPLHKPLTYSWDTGYLKEFFHLEPEYVFSSLDLWQSVSVNLACKPLKLYDSNSCGFCLGTLG